MSARRGGNPRIRIDADADGVRRGVKDAERHLGRLETSGEKSLKRLQTAGALAGTALLGGAVLGLRKSVDAAIEAERSQKALETQLDALGISYRRHGDEIDRVIQKTSQLSGLDDEDLADAFTNIVRITGDVNKSLRLTGLAADFARAKHMDVAKAGEVVAKVAGGNTGILSRYGIVLDENASSTDALAALQEKFAGQAKAAGKTAGGAIDRLNVSAENLAETAGNALAPHIADASNAVANFITEMQNGTGSGGEFAKDAKKVATVVGDIVGFLKDHPRLIAGAVGAWATYKTASVIALSAVKVSSFRDAFAKGKAPAAAQGALAGRTYATSFAASSATAMPGALGKQQGRFRGAFIGFGKSGGLLTAGAFAAAFAPELASLLKGVAKKIGGGGGSVLGDIEDALLGNGAPPRGSENGFGNPAGRGDATPLSPNVPPGARLPKPDREDNGPRNRSARPRRQRHGGRASAATARVSARVSSAPRARASQSSGIVALGRQLQREGYTVGEHPAFGGVAPVHVNGSYHYRGLAIDVNGGPGGEPGSLDALYARLQGKPGVVELLWRVKGHFDHLHVAVEGSANPLAGSSSAPATSRTGAPAAAPRPAAPTPRPMSGSARAQQAFDNSQDRTNASVRNAIKRAAGRRLRPGLPKRPPGKGVEREPGTMADVLAAMPTELDFYERDQAFAGLTEDKSDDLDALRKIQGYWQRQLEQAATTADPRDDTEAAQALAAATAAIKDLTGEMERESRQREQDRQIAAEIVANQQKILALATQGPEIVAAVVAATSGGIGGKVGLGFSTPSYPGGLARY